MKLYIYIQSSHVRRKKCVYFFQIKFGDLGYRKSCGHTELLCAEVRTVCWLHRADVASFFARFAAISKALLDSKKFFLY